MIIAVGEEYFGQIAKVREAGESAILGNRKLGETPLNRQY